MVTGFWESSDSGPEACPSAWSTLSLPDIDLRKQSNFGPEMPSIACSHPKTVKNESPGRLVEKKQPQNASPGRLVEKKNHHPISEQCKPWQATGKHHQPNVAWLLPKKKTTNILFNPFVHLQSLQSTV